MGRTTEQLRDEIGRVDRERLVGFGVLIALVLTGGWLLVVITHVCPDQRPLSVREAVLALEGQGATVTSVRDPFIESRGATLMRASIGATGIIAVVWPDWSAQYLPQEEPGWSAQVVPGYSRDARNVGFYALRGGSEADKAQVRLTISRTTRHLDPTGPIACQDE